MLSAIFALMEIAGYIASLFIGISLGLIGGGGSILTVPVLVYIFGLSPGLAISYSLFVVGSTSLVGSFNSYRKGMIDFKTALLFGISSVITVFITRKFILPLIPDAIQLGNYKVEFSMVTMILFAILMLLASVKMIRAKPIKEEKIQTDKSFFILSLFGIGIGLITGFLGAGGGFLLIPALVLMIKLPMKKAIGTSLLIIALNSSVGFIADTGHYKIEWKFLLTISAIAIGGVLIGGLLSKKIQGDKLKKGFGWFVLVMGTYIIVKELFYNS